MSEIPNHTSPPYSEQAREDALFHYTSASGLIGIIGEGEIRGTAYYCCQSAKLVRTLGYQMRME